MDIITKFLDGAAIVQMLNPGTAKTFQDYADMVFTTYVSSELDIANQCERHLLCVQAREFKKHSQEELRGKGVQKQVLAITVFPQNWKDFLHEDDNKTELFRF